MKRKNLFVLALLSALTISACSDSGFSVIKTPNNDNPAETMENREEDNNVGVDSGGSSAGYDDGDNEKIEKPTESPGADVVTGNEDSSIVAIDTSDKITMFKFVFVDFDDNKLVNVTFDIDPLDSRYNYSFYTVNGYKLDNPVLEKNENEKSYKINLGSIDSGKYTIKFFNRDNKQYGVTYIDIANNTVNTTYIAMAIGVAQIQLAALGYNIMKSMQKIGDFFTWLFAGDTSSGMTFGE